MTNFLGLKSPTSTRPSCANGVQNVWQNFNTQWETRPQFNLFHHDMCHIFLATPSISRQLRRIVDHIFQAKPCIASLGWIITKKPYVLPLGGAGPQVASWFRPPMSPSTIDTSTINLQTQELSELTVISQLSERLGACLDGIFQYKLFILSFFLRNLPIPFHY